MRQRERWEGVACVKGALRKYVFTPLEFKQVNSSFIVPQCISFSQVCAAWAVEDTLFNTLWDLYLAAVNGLGKSGKRLKGLNPSRRFDGSFSEWTVPPQEAVDEESMDMWKCMQQVAPECQVSCWKSWWVFIHTIVDG